MKPQNLLPILVAVLAVGACAEMDDAPTKAEIIAERCVGLPDLVVDGASYECFDAEILNPIMNGWGPQPEHPEIAPYGEPEACTVEIKPWGTSFDGSPTGPDNPRNCSVWVLCEIRDGRAAPDRIQTDSTGEYWSGGSRWCR